MPGETLVTLLSGGDSMLVTARREGDRLRVPAAAVEAATGWALKPQGLCRDDACIPVRDPDALDGDGRVDLAVAATALRRPLAIEYLGEPDDGAVAALGDAAAERADSLRNLEAPAFELPTVDGGTVSLDDFASTKRLLLAWASW